MNKLIQLFVRYFPFLKGYQINDLLVSMEITRIMKMLNSDDLNEIRDLTYDEILTRLNTSQ
ncbi:hypothetical protein WA1_23945 [Scytonema hofmannii PCC 7110]|uniref:Uncharacterized protein n=1 Tax=Scytonema hofmannii PCC 7110 TaxID=128403 RepID=A0A139X7N7_9CYAN|nr:hypothetical protein WA1_23945 [Scytonema hofmannii PCC 7110]